MAAALAVAVGVGMGSGKRNGRDAHQMLVEVELRARDAEKEDVSFEPVVGLELLEGPTTGPALTQYVLPDALAEYTPPSTNTTPSTENGVHGEAPTSAVALEQLSWLLATGTAIHTCDGPCDPD